MTNTRHDIPEGESDVPSLSPEELNRLREQAVAESKAATSDLKEVERHLWIAFELVPNLENIPENRTVFLSHLRESEQRSQGHEKLHLLIGENRRKYEQERIIPNWDLLAKTLYEAMDES